ncbi:hypothetical protein HOG21_05045 [bacterium]|nr:hypothetical protein [bacterium]
MCFQISSIIHIKISQTFSFFIKLGIAFIIIILGGIISKSNHISKKVFLLFSTISISLGVKDKLSHINNH